MSKALEGFLLQLLRSRLDPFTAGIADCVRKGRAAGLPEIVTRQALAEICAKVYNEDPVAPEPATEPVDTGTPVKANRLSRHLACQIRTLVDSGNAQSYDEVADTFGVTVKSLVNVLTFDVWPSCCAMHVLLATRIADTREAAKPGLIVKPTLIASAYGLDDTWNVATRKKPQP